MDSISALNKTNACVWMLVKNFSDLTSIAELLHVHLTGVMEYFSHAFTTVGWKKDILVHYSVSGEMFAVRQCLRSNT
ncbi:hypothetical protein MUK72_19745 (plasmid) [Halococcus dombrowskii]|uniref:Transposase n=1 Tax=Halococcus dombrowskii TaxID=179637 RepID=A0AAX3AUD9_HALDO|nr:hypothetical protein [Halococcus dombrowskii]UOO97378.1 hypothetical protein MUK72_19745 [Halococcus dombrowskii]